MESAAPEDDHVYAVVIGQSLLDGVDQDGTGTGSSGDASVHASFRYEFQPASVDKALPGLVTMDESNGVQVLMGNSTGAPGGIMFKGKAVENKEIDCLLIFDGEAFVLERCPFSCTQLRHVRTAPPVQPAPSRRMLNAAPRFASKTGKTAAASTTASAGNDGNAPPPKKRGRAVGSKNKPKAQDGDTATVPRPAAATSASAPPKKRGRPLGSKNKPKAPA